MTKSEFLQGWKLLVLQPWGWRYNQMAQDKKPTADALAQLEFYFAHVQWAHSAAWMKVATLYASGSEWPSIQELEGSLRAVHGQFVKMIKDKTKKHYCECPAEVSAILDRLMERKSV